MHPAPRTAEAADGPPGGARAIRTRIKLFGGAGRRRVPRAAEFAAKVLPVARENGGTYRHIVAQLTKRGIATAHGKHRHCASVRRLMRHAR